MTCHHHVHQTCRWLDKVSRRHYITSFSSVATQPWWYLGDGPLFPAPISCHVEFEMSRLFKSKIPMSFNGMSSMRPPKIYKDVPTRFRVCSNLALGFGPGLSMDLHLRLTRVTTDKKGPYSYLTNIGNYQLQSHRTLAISVVFGHSHQRMHWDVERVPKPAFDEKECPARHHKKAARQPDCLLHE